MCPRASTYSSSRLGLGVRKQEQKDVQTHGPIWPNGKTAELCPFQHLSCLCYLPTAVCQLTPPNSPVHSRSIQVLTQHKGPSTGPSAAQLQMQGSNLLTSSARSFPPLLSISSSLLHRFATPPKTLGDFAVQLRKQLLEVLQAIVIS